MSYEPTVWANGDIITAEKINKLENGVADSSNGSNFIILGTGVYLDDDFSYYEII